MGWYAWHIISYLAQPPGFFPSVGCLYEFVYLVAFSHGGIFLVWKQRDIKIWKIRILDV